MLSMDFYGSVGADNIRGRKQYFSGESNFLGDAAAVQNGSFLERDFLAGTLNDIYRKNWQFQKSENDHTNSENS